MQVYMAATKVTATNTGITVKFPANNQVAMEIISSPHIKTFLCFNTEKLHLFPDKLAVGKKFKPYS